MKMETLKINRKDEILNFPVQNCLLPQKGRKKYSYLKTFTKINSRWTIHRRDKTYLQKQT